MAHRGGLVSLDINSRRVGVAIGDADSQAPRCFSWSMPGAEDLPRACASISSLLSELCKMEHPAIVVIEAPLTIINSQYGARPAFVLMSLYGAAAGAAHNGGARVVDGNISTWRKSFLGRGNLPGKEAKRLATERCAQLGWKVENHDEADAAGLWAWAMATNFRNWKPQDGTPLFAQRQGAAA